MLRNRTLRKSISVFLLVQFIIHVFAPSVALALTSGPTQPEFSSFEPVSSSNMVDEFTGDFTYNLPLLEVPGPHGGSYPVSISYHSGATPEEEASWVGFGWTLNSGAINRSVRGLPDDYKDSRISNYNKTPENWTVTLGAGAFWEVLSKDPGMFQASLSASCRYNNYRGFGFIKNAGVVLGKGLVSMGYSVNEGEGSFSMQVQPMAILDYGRKTGDKDSEKQKDKDLKLSDGFRGFFRGRSQTTLKDLTTVNLGSRYGMFTQGVAPLATNFASYTGVSVNVSAAFDVNPTPMEMGVGVNVMGSFSTQSNVPLLTSQGFGYLYSQNADANTNHQMDYHIEKDNPFDKQDEFIGIPFNDADQFAISGEGIGGGFRLYHSTVGHFGPTWVKSSMDIFSVSPELEAGANWGGGVDVGTGFSNFTIRDWVPNRKTVANSTNALFPDVATNQAAETATIDEPAFFRFNNDLGGSWGEKVKYNDTPVRFNLTSSGVPGGNIDFAINSKQRGGRSSYIGYHTNSQLSIDASKTTAYSKRNWSTFIDRTQGDYKIGEMAITNEDGMHYVYGLPVYSRNERNLSFGLDGVPANKIENSYIAYEKRESQLKVGQERPEAYANTYLLTEILTPDYIDKPVSGVFNGPTADDLGGYVRFGYDKIFGDKVSGNTWYKWRTPYNGVSIQRNKISDRKDDIGTLASGEKEIYYLKTIETKTHVAIFYTLDRNDGMGALDDDAAMTPSAKSTNRLKKLDRIELYSLNALGTIVRDASGNIDPASIPSTVKPIKTVHLDYAENGVNDLMDGAPNAENSSYGRLTLSRIYFEYNGVTQAKLSPYIFEYKYPTVSYPNTAPANYSGFEKFGSTVAANWTAAAACNAGTDPENPRYSPFNIDAWGNFQPYGCDQYANMRTWNDQSKIPNVHFDPAPWHLKKIELPSGGQIHVQYEQDDYQYVQDQDAHVMVPLKSLAGQTDNRFYLDLAALGYNNLSAADKTTFRNNLVSMISKRYKNTKKKIYFKFLFKMKGTDSSDPFLAACNTNAEYITGYSKLVDVGQVGEDVFIDLGATKTAKALCNEFVNTNVIGKVETATDCNPSAGMMAMSNQSDTKSKALAMVQAFFGAGTTLLSGSQLLASNYCQTINESLSYFRVPTVNPKKGGGVRVKRLLMYDNSLDGAVLYGTQYDYTTTDDSGRKISSGVATNEPAGNREENILVDYIPKKKQGEIDRMIAGRDKEVQEGPIGESVYPGASVGYSKITVTNIFTGKTNPGFSVSEFYTVKDFPVKVAMTAIAGNSKTKYSLGIFSNKFINNVNALQGFSVTLNNMHGQVKRKSSYGYSGDYSTGVDMTKSTLVAEQVFDYYKPGEDLPVMTGTYGAVTMKSIGREVDFSLSQRSISESSVDGGTEIDLSAGFFGLLVVPLFNYMGSMTTTEGNLNQHATTKVVRYPSVVKKVTTYQDGIYHSDEYVAFSDLTGKPVAVKSEDEFKGAYLNQSIPAGWEYPAITQVSQSENRVVVNPYSAALNINIEPAVYGRYKVTFTGTTACTTVTNFTAGDLVRLFGEKGDMTWDFFHVDAVDYGADCMYLVPTAYSPTQILLTMAIDKIVIKESGRTNQLSQMAGSIQFHDSNKDNVDPQDFTDGSRYLTNSFTSALETGYEGAQPNFTLTATYSNMNMSAYSSYVTNCNTDWTKANVKNLYFTKITNSTTKTLVLTRFDIECSPGTWITVQR